MTQVRSRFAYTKTFKGWMLLFICCLGFYKGISNFYKNHQLSHNSVTVHSQPITDFGMVMFSRQSDNFRVVRARFTAQNGKNYTCDAKITIDDMMRIQKNNGIGLVKYYPPNPKVCTVENFYLDTPFLLALMGLMVCFIFFGNYMVFRD